jgi:peptidoglycan hydrolase CwlO-like protein
MEAPRKFAINQRALGVGVLGWHSLLQSKMIPFESMDAKLLNGQIWDASLLYSQVEKTFKFEAIGKTLDDVNQYYGSVKNLTETMTDSVKEAARTKEQLTSLANNLEQLNALYGNMIKAIKGN